MKVLGSTEWRAFSSGCREVVHLRVHTGWRMERFDKRHRLSTDTQTGVGLSPSLLTGTAMTLHSVEMIQGRPSSREVKTWL